MASDISRARTLARILDDDFVDPILGFLLPGLGDLIGSLIGLYVVSIAIRRRLPRIVIARMLMNLAIDAALGIVPLVGDAADVAFKANRRNVDLLESRAAGGDTWRDWSAVMLAFILLAGAITLSVWMFVKLVRWVF